MAIVRQTANLTRWNAASSDLDINGVPPNYDTQGKLGNLPPAASQLDFNGPLPSPVSFFLNTNADGFTLNAVAQVTQFKSNGQTSRYGFVGVLPSPINSFANTNADGFTLQAPFQVTQFKSDGQTSQFGFPGALPSPVNSFANTNADGFTLNAPFQISQFKSNGQTSLFGFPGALPSPVNYFLNTNSDGFTLNAPFQQTQFKSDGQTSLYGIPGGPTPVNFFLNTNADGFTLNAPFQTTQFKSNGQTSLYGIPAGPTPTNFFLNTNASGFTLNAPSLVTQFVGNGQTSLYGIPGGPTPVNYFANTNANGFTLNAPFQVTQFVGNGQTSQYGFAGALPSPVNYFANTNAAGFTLNMPALVSDYVGNGQTSLYGFAGALPAPVNYFLNINASGFTLNAPSLVSEFVPDSSRYTFPGALPPPTNFFLNTNASGFTLNAPALASEFVPDSSQYTFPGALPAPVNFFLNTNASGFTLNAPALASEFVPDSSRFTFPGALPSPVDFIFNIYASGFTLQAPPLVTQFLDPGNQSIYGFAGPLPAPVDFFNNDHRPGFILQAQTLVSHYVGNGQTSAYGFPGALPAPVNFFDLTAPLHQSGFTLQAVPLVTNFLANGQTSRYGFAGALPTPVDFFDLAGGSPPFHAKGFTLQAPFQVTQFLARGQTSQYGLQSSAYGVPVDFFDLNGGSPPFHQRGFNTWTTPLISQFIANGQTSRYGFSSPYGTPVNFFYDFDRKGFLLFQQPLMSYFAGLTSTSFSSFRWQTQLGTANFFPDLDATGFTLRTLPLVTHFTGASGQTFSSPRWQTQLGVQNNFLDATSGAEGFTLRQALLDTKFIGVAGESYNYPGSVLGRRLWQVPQGPWVGGTAKLDNQLGVGSPKFKNSGWNVTNKYAPTGQYASLSAAGNLNTYGVGQLATQYSYSSYYGHELKLRNTAFNPSYIKHPLILRGIQNGTEPQWWGTGAQFEGDPPRGGAVAVANRIVADVERIGKIMISPQGIVWNINQLLLAKLNPDSETPASKIRIGPVVLASVAGTALGIHIQSNNLGPEYEEVVKIKNAGTGPGMSFGPNRLVTLTNTVLQAGNPIIPVALRGKRATNTWSIWAFKDPYAAPLIDRVGITDGQPAYYASVPKAVTAHLGNATKLDFLNRTSITADALGIQTLMAGFIPGQHRINPVWTAQGIPSKGISGPAKAPPTPSSDVAAQTPWNPWVALPYTELPKDRSPLTPGYNNFQVGLSREHITKADIDYSESNIHAKYGFGEHGKPKKDRTNPYVNVTSKKNPDGDQINLLDYKSASETGIYSGVNDFIQFYFAGINMGVGDDDVVPFRATVKNISDSFNPSWSPINIMGRPDSPALYSSFERNVSFDFMVAATTREELYTMWRKLNYLATFTMPIYGTNSRPQGPVMRLTIGHMYRNLPGYITNLTIAVNEEATWDISSEGGGRQLPNIVDVNCSFNIVHDYRAQKGGAVYSLYDGIYAPKGGGSWIPETTVG